jgi:hypothetical protein
VAAKQIQHRPFSLLNRKEIAGHPSPVFRFLPASAMASVCVADSFWLVYHGRIEFIVPATASPSRIRTIAVAGKHLNRWGHRETHAKFDDFDRIAPAIDIEDAPAPG